MLKAYIDPIDGVSQYTTTDTIAIAISHEGGRSIAIKFLSRHNVLFDVFKETKLSTIFLSIPCFIRLVDYAGYKSYENEIITQYSTSRDVLLPPLIVFGDGKIFHHPLIFSVDEATPKACWQIYKRYRRRAKLQAKREK